MTHEEQHHSGSLFQGIVIFIFLAFLTLVEFAVAVTNQSLLLLAILALIKVGLVVYYYMHIYKLLEEEHDHDHHSYAWKLATNRLGLWLFLLSDAFVFGGLLVGGDKMQRAMQVPSAMIQAILGLVVVFVVSTEIWSRRRARRRESRG